LIDLSYQLYSSRNFPPLNETFSTLAEIGYSQVEGYGDLFTEDGLTDLLLEAMQESDLPMPTAHMPLELVVTEPDRVIEIAKAVGIETVFVPYLDAPLRPDDSKGWLEFGARLDEAGGPLRAAGIGFGYHNHDFEFEELPSGDMPMDLLLEGGPNLLWEVDAAWILRAGIDPKPFLTRFSDRVAAVHIKDIAAEGTNELEDGWADLGEGIVDWAGLLKAFRDTSCRHFVLEHDNPSDSTRFAETSFNFIRKL
jgi:sugar phosphate isomerase/epimerase